MPKLEFDTELLNISINQMSNLQLTQYIKWMDFILDLIQNDIRMFYFVTGLDAIPMTHNDLIDIVQIEQAYQNKINKESN